MDGKQERPGGLRTPGAFSSWVVGLTGGIASGKSTVARTLESLGAQVVDADQVSRELVEPGSPVLAALVDAWGKDILDAEGRLDRAALASRVFGQPDEVARLNGLTHPPILAEMQRRIAASGRAVVVLMAPLLFEAGADALVDEVWVVRAAPELRLARLRQRDALTEEQGRHRLAVQMDENERAARADVVIDNQGDRAALEQCVRSAWQSLVARVRHGNREE